MTPGSYISGIGHGGLILWALFGGFFISARDPLPVQAADVSLISNQEFAALSLPDQAPPVPFEAPVPVTPDAPDTAPQVLPNADDPPVPENPGAVAQPDTETTPVAPDDIPEPQTELIDDAPAVPTPPQPESAPVLAEPDETPTPAPAPRVAPEPAAPAPPDSVVADTETPEVLPDDTADTVAEETPAAAPDEAATEIVTEAETPSSAPVASARPTARPVRPAEAAEPAEPENDPVAAAVAEAVASETPAPTAPTGPPLTGGEREGFRIAVGKCWNVDSGSAAASVTVTVGFSLDQTGKVVAGSLDFIEATDGDAGAVKAAFEAARRAIIRCGAKGFNLPLEKYSQWQDIEITFNPEGMRIK